MINVRVCLGISCHHKGAYNIMLDLQRLVEKNELHEKVKISSSYCTGNCQKGVNVKVEDQIYSVSPEQVKTFFNETVLPLIK